MYNYIYNKIKYMYKNYIIVVARDTTDRFALTTRNLFRSLVSTI